MTKLKKMAQKYQFGESGGERKNQRTNGPINAHLRSGICDLS